MSAVRAKRSARAVRIGAIILAAAAAFPTRAVAAPRAPVPARQVGYVSAPVRGGFEYFLSCAGDPTFGDLVVADGIALPLGGMPVFFSVRHHRSTKGHFTQVGDRYIEHFEERVEEPVGGGGASFSLSGTTVGPGQGILYFAWAVWQGGLKDCRFELDDQPLPITWLPSDHAIYVGPEVFTGGIFHQNGAVHRSYGRTFVIQPRERVVMGHLVIGSRLAIGRFSSDDMVHGGGGSCGSSCNFGWPNARIVGATIIAGEDDDGVSGQLWLFNVPK